MKIPKSVRIGGIIYKVRYVDMDEGRMGMLNRKTNELLLANDIMESQAELTFIHEILHAINGEVSDQIVDSFAQGIHQVFKDNKLWKGGKKNAK